MERQILQKAVNKVESTMTAALDPKKEMERCGLENWQRDSNCRTCHCCQRDLGGSISQELGFSKISHCRFCGFISGTQCCITQTMQHPKTHKPEKACDACLRSHLQWEAFLQELRSCPFILLVVTVAWSIACQRVPGPGGHTTTAPALTILVCVSLGVWRFYAAANLHRNSMASFASEILGDEGQVNCRSPLNT
jgi:hypothetical protein